MKSYLISLRPGGAVVAGLAVGLLALAAGAASVAEDAAVAAEGAASAEENPVSAAVRADTSAEAAVAPVADPPGRSSGTVVGRGPEPAADYARSEGSDPAAEPVGGPPATAPIRRDDGDPAAEASSEPPATAPIRRPGAGDGPRYNPMNAPPTAAPAPVRRLPGNPFAGGGRLTVRVFQLQHAEATEVAEILQQLYGAPWGTFLADRRANSIVSRANDEVLEEVAALIKELDAAAAETEDSGGMIGGAGGRRMPMLPGAPAAPMTVPRNVADGIVAPGMRVPGMVRPSVATVTRASSVPDLASLQEDYQRLEHEAARLAAAHRQEREEGAKQRLQQQLEQTVREAFAARQRMQEAKVAHLRQELSTVEQSIRTRAKLQDKIIEKRVQDLLQTDPLQWEPQVSGRVSGAALPATGALPAGHDPFGSRGASSGRNLPSRTAPGKREGKVQVERLEDGSLLLRGSPEDVDRLTQEIRDAREAADGSRPTTAPPGDSAAQGGGSLPEVDPQGRMYRLDMGNKQLMATDRSSGKLLWATKIEELDPSRPWHIIDATPSLVAVRSAGNDPTTIFLHAATGEVHAKFTKGSKAEESGPDATEGRPRAESTDTDLVPISLSAKDSVSPGIVASVTSSLVEFRKEKSRLDDEIRRLSNEQAQANEIRGKAEAIPGLQERIAARRKQIAALQDEYRAMIRAAELRLQLAEERVDEAKGEFDRLMLLREKKAVSGFEVEKALSTLNQLRIAQQLAESALEALAASKQIILSESPAAETAAPEAEP